MFFFSSNEFHLEYLALLSLFFAFEKETKVVVSKGKAPHFEVFEDGFPRKTLSGTGWEQKNHSNSAEQSETCRKVDFV